jgi:uncharacterized alkaline shock family protein YloU
VVSRVTRTRKVQVVRLVQSSVAVHVTVVVPTGNRLPEAGEHVTATLASALSVAAGTGYETTAPLPEHAATLIFPGQVMAGGVTSRATVTVNVQVVRFVQSSVAVQVTVVVPGGNSEPDGGEQVTVTFGSALSVAIGGGHDT